MVGDRVLDLDLEFVSSSGVRGELTGFHILSCSNELMSKSKLAIGGTCLRGEDSLSCCGSLNFCLLGDGINSIEVSDRSLRFSLRLVAGVEVIGDAILISALVLGISTTEMGR